jgi:nucleotide-binding universal stress UspA family protein
MRTIVGWDGSEPADQALRWAAEREWREGWPLHIVRVLDVRTCDAAADVATARRELQHAMSSLADANPDVAVTAELAAGDPVVELARIADRSALLVVGASRVDRIRNPNARRVPTALMSRTEGLTAVVPAHAPEDRHGVVAVVRGRSASAGTLAVAAAAAATLGEPMTLLRIRDPYEPADGGALPTLEPERRALERDFPEVVVHFDPHWIRGPISLLSYSDEASLLVLEGHRPSSAPPRFSLERWLAGRARAPFVVVAEPLVLDSEPRVEVQHGLVAMG